MLKEQYNNTLFDFDIKEVLTNGRYDLRKYKKEDNNYNDLELNEIGFEINKQNFIFDQVLKFISSCYREYKVYVKRIINYNNYYFVNVLGRPYKEIQFIFDKNCRLKFSVSYDNGRINCIDDSNFVIFSKFEKNRTKQINIADDSCHYIEGVYSDILPFLDVHQSIKFGNLVSWYNKGRDAEKKVLYNYKEKRVVVPEYFDVYYSYTKGANPVRSNDFIWVTYFCSYDYKFTFLDFLVDVDGNLKSDVYDYGRNIKYSIADRGDDQIEILNSIYEEAKDYLVKSVSNNYIYSRVLRKNKLF